MNHPTRINLQQLILLQQQARQLTWRPNRLRSPVSGQHLSRLRGRGMEFDEVRIYQPGDDVSRIDWRVTARKGTPHTKLFREERERPVLICMDYRPSMFFATRGALKSVIASQAAALLAWGGIGHGDRLGGLIFSDRQHHELRPGRGRKAVLHFLHQCCNADVWQAKRSPQHQSEAVEQSLLAEALMRLRHITKPGSLIIFLSDFRGLDEANSAQLIQLSRHNELLLVHIYDALEQQLPPAGAYRIHDGDTAFTIDSSHSSNRQQLEKHFTERSEHLDTLCRRYGMHRFTLRTDDAVAETLQAAPFWS